MQPHDVDVYTLYPIGDTDSNTLNFDFILHIIDARGSESEMARKPVLDLIEEAVNNSKLRKPDLVSLVIPYFKLCNADGDKISNSIRGVSSIFGDGVGMSVLCTFTDDCLNSEINKKSGIKHFRFNNSYFDKHIISEDIYQKQNENLKELIRTILEFDGSVNQTENCTDSGNTSDEDESLCCWKCRCCISCCNSCRSAKNNTIQ